MSFNVMHVVGNPPAPFVNDLVSNQLDHSDLSVQYVVYQRKSSAIEQIPGAHYVDQNAGWVERVYNKLPFSSVGGAPILRLRRIHELLEAKHFDLIHTHFGWSIWGCIDPLFQRFDLDIPVLVSVHGTDILSKVRENETRREIFLRFCARPKVHVAVASDFMREEALKLGVSEEKISRISNAVPEGLFAPRSSRSVDDVFRIACTARLVSWKGHDVLIQAFAKFLKKHPCRAELILMGGGTEEARLGALVDSLGITDAVCFTGQLEREAISKHLIESDLYVQPSRRDPETNQCETFGIAILEAISTGLPVVVSDCGGIPEVVGSDRRYAEVIPQNDVSALSEAICRAYAKRGEPFDNRDYAQERMQRFSTSRQLDECLAAYRKMTAS